MGTRLVILGSGSFAIEALDIAQQLHSFEVIGFVNNVDELAPGTLHAGLPVFSPDSLPAGPADCLAVAAIVSNRRRGVVADMARRGYRFVSLIHPSAVVSPRATIESGCVIGAGTVVSTNTVLRQQVIVNRGCLIGHDNDIGAFTTLGPGANVAGGVTIQEDAYIGVGAVVRDHLSIGRGAVVGAGSVVVKSVDAGALVTGVPARVVRTGMQGL
jgi:sugar O-acyltransferase (sialic acid O-acetyltransferase NeuD family)